MENKEIIVDNVDVSGCEFLITSNNRQLCRCIKLDLFGGIEFVENAKFGNCKDNPNCYYKQHKHKEKECESWKKVNDEKNELLAKLGCPTAATARMKAFTLQQQLEQLKKTNEESQKKNEELRKEVEAIYDNCKGCPTCNEALYNANLYAKEYRTLKQALAEIKEIVEPYYIICSKDSPVAQTLQKISECEVE